MIHDDPLLRTYRDAAELYLRVVDMPSELRERYLTTVCVGRDLLKFTVEELVRGDAADGSRPAGEDARCVSADRVTATLIRFTDALNTVAPAHPEVTAYVPGAYDSDRERTLAELVKLEQKSRWAARRPKPLEVYLREWPELRAPATVAELLRSECLTRAVYGSPASDRELSLRFPDLCSTIDLNALEKRAQMIARALSSGGSGVAPTADRFSIVRKIGQGGMGIVYEAIDRQRGSTVALKTLPHMDPRALFRLKREFRTLADLVHPNLVALYELVSDGSEWLFTMELVDGVDFMTHVGSRTPGGRIDDDALRSVVRQLAEGVSALHASQILHCDLKPSNVLVRHDGRVVILDFGIAKELSRGRSAAEAMPVLQTPTGPAMRSTWSVDEYLVGSVAYMSPEQAEGIELTPASDWYSVGAMLYEALAGHIPFAGDPDLIWTKQLQDPTPPSGIAANVPADLEELCLALLSREPDDRPAGPEILQLLADRRSTSRAPATTPRGLPFVGRANQLAILDSAYARLRESPTVTVHIHGKSGAGKTALAQQFLSTLPAGITVLAGRCYEQESVPYKALDSVIDRLCRHLMQLPSTELSKLIPADIAALARIFPVLQRVDDIQAACAGRPEIPDLRELRRRAFAALAALLHGLSETAPLVVFIDDLQWGDVDSAALLLSLLDTPHPPPMLFVACYRAEYTDSNPCLLALAAAREHQVCFDVDVEPLPFGDSLTLASSLLPAADSDTAARVAVESGGNPYFLYELAWQLNGAVASDAASLTLNLDEVLWRRVTMLPPEARHLLEVIATAAKPLPLNRAADAGAFKTDVAAAVSVLRAEHLVRTTGPSVDDYVETYHDRIRETVTSHLSEPARREHHHRLAIAFEAAGHTDLEETASHFHRAELPEMAAQHYALAAEKASAALAFQRSAELYGLAIGLGHPEGASARQLHRRRADALANAGRGYDAGQEYQLASKSAEPHDIIELQRNAGYQFCVSGHIDEGREAFGVVLAHLGMKLPRTRRQALLSLLWRRFRLRLRGMRVRERPEHTVSRGRARPGGHLLVGRLRYDDRRSHSRRGLPDARSHPRPRGRRAVPNRPRTGMGGGAHLDDRREAARPGALSARRRRGARQAPRPAACDRRHADVPRGRGLLLRRFRDVPALRDRGDGHLQGTLHGGRLGAGDVHRVRVLAALLQRASTASSLAGSVH